MDENEFYSKLSKDMDKNNNILSALHKILIAFEKENKEDREGKDGNQQIIKNNNIKPQQKKQNL